MANPVHLLNPAGDQQVEGHVTAKQNLRLYSDTDFLGTLDHAITAARTWTLPNTTGTLALTSDLVTDHGALTGLLDDDHTQYRLESADHSHQSTGLQAGQLDHGLALTGLGDDDHTQYGLKSGTLAQFSATTSAELFSIISNETGGGGVLVGNASPTFTTQITTPIVYGGSAAGSTLTLAGTSNGTPSNAHVFLNPLGEGRVVIGYTAPVANQGKFQVIGTDGDAEVYVARISADAGGPTYAVQKARGTPASPANVQDGDTVGNFAFQARSGSSFFNGGTIVGAVDGTFTSGQRPPSRFEFQTNLANQSQTTRLIIRGDGTIGIGGVTSPTAQLHVDQASTTGAIPVLLLDQADIDQPILEMVADIGVGSTIEAVGAKVLTTTHFVMVKIPGGLTRYFPVGTIA